MKNCICALSNEIANEPVISPVSGRIFEKRLILKYLKENDNRDPINGNKLNEDQLIILNEISLSKNIELNSRKANEFTIPELIEFIQEQWDAKTLQMFDLKKQLIASDKKVENLLNKLNDLSKIVHIQNNKLIKYKQAEEERKYLNELNYFKQSNDNVYSNLPNFENKENLNFGSSINSSNCSSFKGSNNHLIADHRLTTGTENAHHHLSNHTVCSSTANHSSSVNYSNNHSSISSEEPVRTCLFLNDQYFNISKFSRSDDLVSPKLISNSISPKLINDLLSPKYDNLENSTKLNDLTNSRLNTISNQSPSSFQKFNKLSYSTEYVNLNNNRLIDRNFRTQSVIIQTDNLFDNDLNSMKSCEDNLNYRNNHSKRTNHKITPSSSGSLKGFSENTINGLINCDSNYINIQNEVDYCNLREMKDFDERATNLTRRPKSTMKNYENIPIINEDYDLKSSQHSINKFKMQTENHFHKIDRIDNKIDEFDKTIESKGKQCAKVSKIETWSKDFNNLLNDTLGRKAFTVSF